MFEWLKNKYIEYKKKNHINKEVCFVIPTMPKSLLIDHEYYETFDFSHQWAGFRTESWWAEFKTKKAEWSAEKDCFVDRNHL